VTATPLSRARFAVRGSRFAVPALTGVLALAAGVARQPTETSGLREFSFTRQVAPFDIVDESGRPYALPFLGGLDVPRPQFVDIDADGDLDLFVQEYSNALMFFENTGSAAAARFTWRSDRYQDLEIGEWYRFADIDADGLVDLIAELPFSRIRHYRNTGSRAAARFTDAGAILDADDGPLFFDRQNIPAPVDLDCDDRLDLFVGRIEGTVTRYEAVEPGSRTFALIQEFWEGIEIIGRVGDVGSMFHGANALAFADFEGDRDLDLFWGDFFEPGVLLIENIGRTCSTPSFQVNPVRLPFADTATSGYNTPIPIDLDRDGDLDFLMGVIGGAFNPVATSTDNFYFWRRTAGTRFELETRRFLDGLDLGSETTPALGDLDADGDLDLVVGNKIDAAAGDAARLYVFLNEGSASAPRFRQSPAMRVAGAYHLAPALGDLDGDGDLDLLVGTWNQGVLFLRNEGSARDPRFALDDAGAIEPPRAGNASPALADLDGDGDLDLLIGQSSGPILHYRNAGTSKAARWELVTEALDGIRIGRRSAPALVDLDTDGLLDLVVGREEGGHAVFRNAGTRTSPRFVAGAVLPVALPPLATPAFADLDGDGVPDLISGGAGGGLQFYRGGLVR